MSVRGASRASFAALTERLATENVSNATVATQLGNELFAVVGLLDTEHGAVAGAAAAGQGDRRDPAADHPDGDASPRARADRGPGHVRRPGGPAAAAADRGGTRGGRAVRRPAPAPGRRAGRLLRAPG